MSPLVAKYFCAIGVSLSYFGVDLSDIYMTGQKRQFSNFCCWFHFFFTPSRNATKVAYNLYGETIKLLPNLFGRHYVMASS